MELLSRYPNVPDIHEMIEVRATHFKIMERAWVTREDFMREFSVWERSESLQCGHKNGNEKQDEENASHAKNITWCKVITTTSNTSTHLFC